MKRSVVLLLAAAAATVWLLVREIGQAPPPEPPQANRAALCVSGQFRTFRETYSTILDLTTAFPDGADVFFFVSRNASDNATRFDDAIAAVAPVVIQYYDSTSTATPPPGVLSYEAEAPPTGQCHRDPIKDPLRHFSYHGPQFWGVGKCFDLVRARERATGTRYAWAARLRPDQNHTADEVAAAARIVATHDPRAGARVWYRRKKQSDAFALMTRGAVDAYASVWEDEYKAEGCIELGLANVEDQHRLKVTCSPMGLNYRFGTECMVTAHLVLRGNVTVTGDDALAPKLVRLVPPTPRLRVETAAQRAERLTYKSAIENANRLVDRLETLNYSYDGAGLQRLIAGLGVKLDVLNRSRHGEKPSATRAAPKRPVGPRIEDADLHRVKKICRIANAGGFANPHERDQWRRLCQRATRQKEAEVAEKRARKEKGRRY